MTIFAFIFLSVAAFTTWGMGNERNTSTGCTRMYCTHTKWPCGSICGHCVQLWVYHYTWPAYTFIYSFTTRHLPVSQRIASHCMHIQNIVEGI